MDEIVEQLLRETAALGVWLLGEMTVTNNRQHNVVLAGAVREPSIKPPDRIMLESETYLEIDGRQLHAVRIGRATLVILFDDRSSFGLIRLRVRHAKDAIVRAVATLVPSGSS